MADLVSRDEAVESRGAITLTQPCAEKITAKSARPGNSHGRAVEVLAGIEMGKSIGVLSRGRRPVVRYLVEQQGRVRFIGERISRVAESLDQVDRNLYAELCAEYAVDPVEPIGDRRGSSDITAFVAGEFEVANRTQADLFDSAWRLGHRPEFTNQAFERCLPAGHQRRRATTHRPGRNLHVGKAKDHGYVRIDNAVAGCFDRIHVLAIEEHAARDTVCNNDSRPGAWLSRNLATVDLNAVQHRVLARCFEHPDVRLELEVEAATQGVETHDDGPGPGIAK